MALMDGAYPAVRRSIRSLCRNPRSFDFDAGVQFHHLHDFAN